MSHELPARTTDHWPIQTREDPSSMNSRMLTLIVAAVAVCAAVLHAPSAIDFVEENRPAMFVAGGYALRMCADQSAAASSKRSAVTSW